VKTIVTVHGYEGDAHQIRDLMPCYEHHHLPIVIVTPEDSRIENMGPHICRWGGQREYIGLKSFARQVEHWKIMLDYDATHYLCNDSDSFCLAPELPAYLYAEDVVWSNEVSDMMHKLPAPYAWPRFAMQPPYFLSRGLVERLIAAAPLVEPDPRMLFIDWFFMACCVRGNIPHKNFRDGLSCGTAHTHGLRVMTDAVWRHGKIFVHSIKNAAIRRQLEFARKQYIKNHP
jgi:hypothetical protein